MNLNKERVKQLQSGEVVLYTGDKKGSDEVKALISNCKNDLAKEGLNTFYGICEDGELDYICFIEELNNRPIHPIEWFYEEDLTRRLKDFDDGYKEGYQDGISGVKSKY